VSHEPLDLETLEPAFSANPYPVYDRLRRSSPVRRVLLQGLPGWLVTRYEDVKQALADPRLSTDVRKANPAACAAAPWLGGDVALGLGRHMLNSDPPDHTRLRQLVSRAFTPARIEALRPRIERIADDLIAEFLPRGRADLVDEFAVPLPCIVIMELLGVPTEDRRDFRRWCDLAAVEPEDPAQAYSAFVSIREFLSSLIARRSRELAGGTDAGDLLSALVAIRDEGRGQADDAARLTDEELLSMAFLLLIAGLETVADLIGNGMLALFRSPDLMAALRHDPSLVEAAVEEFLRADGPVEVAIWRFATTDVELGGVTVPSGEVVMLALASADHDPARYADPDTVDLRRDTVGHLGFGFGPHFCLGAPLARMEARIAFRALLDRCAGIALIGDPADLQWRHSPNVRGVKHLPVSFVPVPTTAMRT
jgi:cytochrome P450